MNNIYKYKYEKYKSKYLKFKGGNATSTTTSRYQGCLYGACVGDALGSRYEFLESEEAKKLIIQDIKTNSNLSSSSSHIPSILGGGPFNLHPGQISDDSEMLLCLMKSVYTNKAYNQEDVAKNYITWFNSDPVDVGKTISRALFTRQKSENNKDLIKNSKELNNTSLSNGSLMRIAPLAILALKTNLLDTQIKKLVNLECELTHPNSIIKDASYIYILAIKSALLNHQKKKIYRLLLKKSTEPRVKIIIKDSLDAPVPTYIIDDLQKEVYITPDSKRYQGYFGIALQNALYELFNGVDFNISLVDIAKRGGDVDTNCAIAGALLGSYYGVDNIDKKWLEIVKKANYPRVDKYPDYKVSNIDKYLDF